MMKALVPNLWLRQPARRHSAEGNGARLRQGGFTMVEIALCLGIIAFALVAIIGVLPVGMRVQKENWEETVINQEAMMLLEAIRSGARGMNELTNHVESIQLTQRVGTRTRTVTYTNSPAAGRMYLTNGQHIVGLLSTPKYINWDLQSGASAADSTVERIAVQMRAMTGLAGEKSPKLTDMAFRYLALVEIVPFNAPAMGMLMESHPEDRVHALELRQNLYQLRLTLRWPLYDRGGKWEPGRNRKVYRTLVSGEMKRLSTEPPYNLLVFFEPSTQFPATGSLVDLNYPSN